MKKSKITRTIPRSQLVERIRRELRLGLRPCVWPEEDPLEILALIDALALESQLARSDQPDGERVVVGPYKDLFFLFSHTWGVDGDKSTYLALIADVRPLLNSPLGKQRIDRLTESLEAAKSNEEVWATFTEELIRSRYGDEGDDKDDYVTTF
jgi:hypothetical protein